MAVLVGLAFYTIFMAAICLMVKSLLDSLPEEHRQLEMRQVWWLLVPCFSLAWNFFVFPKLARSYAAYFRSQGSSDADGTGDLALGYCIVSVISVFDVLGTGLGRGAFQRHFVALAQLHEVDFVIGHFNSIQVEVPFLQVMCADDDGWITVCQGVCEGTG